MEGHSAREDTAITMRSIREILAESDEPHELLSSAPKEAEAQEAPSMQAEHDIDAAPVEEKPPLHSRLKSRLFGD